MIMKEGELPRPQIRYEAINTFQRQVLANNGILERMNSVLHSINPEAQQVENCRLLIRIQTTVGRNRYITEQRELALEIPQQETEENVHLTPTIIGFSAKPGEPFGSSDQEPLTDDQMGVLNTILGK
jgi:hypothetical protein